MVSKQHCLINSFFLKGHDFVLEECMMKVTVVYAVGIPGTNFRQHIKEILFIKNMPLPKNTCLKLFLDIIKQRSTPSPGYGLVLTHILLGTRLRKWWASEKSFIYTSVGSRLHTKTSPSLPESLEELIGIDS